MATIAQRIAALELKKNLWLDVKDMTDAELLAYLGLTPETATDEQLQAIINKGASHDK